MKTYMKRSLSLAALAVVALHVQACDSFVEVGNPNNLETSSIDPKTDAALLSQSAYQAFSSGIREIPVYEAWFTNRARVGDTFPTRNEIGRRNIPETNTHTTVFWNSIHSSLQFARTAIRATEGAGPTIDLARDWFVSGSAILLQAELFCEGTIAASTTESRGKMTTNQLLDSAIADFRTVQDIASKVTGTGATEAGNLSTASQVLIARALLQKGDKANASKEAAKVPASFVYNLIRIDNSSTRSLGSGIWNYSESRISLVVSPEFRAMADSGDPRIAYVDAKRLAQDGVLQFYRQNKIKGWGDSDRWASGLEAQYIKVEADANPADMLAFINQRRAVGKQPALAAGLTPGQLLTELMVQRARDFWLEGLDVMDLRRNPSNFPYILPPGNTYYKPELGPVQNDVCWPVPQSEKRNNPNWTA
jgi:hypothetical protein